MRALSLLAAAAMVVSLFLPWLALPGGGFTPYDLVRQLNPDLQAVQDFAGQAPPLMLAFLATFALAALFLILAIVGLASRLLALLAGGLAVGIVAYGFWQAREGALQTGLPLPSTGDLADLAASLGDTLGYGAWAWGLGALVLLLGGLVGFARR